MTKIVLIFILIASYYACSDGRSQKRMPITEPAHTDVVSDRNTEKNVYALINDSASVWHGKNAVWLVFDKGHAVFLYYLSCSYSYDTQIVDDDKIVFFWNDNINCTYDMGMKKTFGLSQKPIVGKPFGEFVLVNDTLLKVNYYYPEWVEKINIHSNDTIFPTMFVLDPRIFDHDLK